MTGGRELLVFGMGFSASHFAQRMIAKGWAVTGTSRHGEGRQKIAALGAAPRHFDSNDEKLDDELKAAILKASHVLISAGPDEHGDPVLLRCRERLRVAPDIEWLGYLSTVGVYGDHGGDWVDETSECRPLSTRSVQRVAAEKAWLDFAQETNIKTQVFRLGGIYGPGSGPLEKLKAGKSRRIEKPGQVFNRIHVTDIANALEAAIDGKSDHMIFNVVDNEPAPPQDVIAYGAELLGIEPPPLIHIDDAAMTPMARSFYGENKRVSNARLREDLGVVPAYPTYREGLKALLERNQKSGKR